MTTYRPHRWRWLNGFWAECSCGHTDSGYLMGGIRRRMNRHVEIATAADLAAAQINKEATR